jgi:hypothetical protein
LTTERRAWDINFRVRAQSLIENRAFVEGPKLALVPVHLDPVLMLRFSPGSIGQEAGWASPPISPGLLGTFSHGLCYKPGLKGLWQAAAGRGVNGHPVVPVCNTNRD